MNTSRSVDKHDCIEGDPTSRRLHFQHTDRPNDRVAPVRSRRLSLQDRSASARMLNHVPPEPEPERGLRGHRSSPLEYMSDAVKDARNKASSHGRVKSSEMPVPVQPKRRAQRRASVSGMASIPAMQPERDLRTPRSSSLHLRRTNAMKDARNQVSEHLDEYDAIVGDVDPETSRYQASTRLLDSMDEGEPNLKNASSKYTDMLTDRADAMRSRRLKMQDRLLDRPSSSVPPEPESERGLRSHRSSPLEYMRDAVKDDQSQSPSHRRAKSSEMPVPVQPKRRAQRRASVSGMASIPAMQPERDLQTHRDRADVMRCRRLKIQDGLLDRSSPSRISKYVPPGRERRLRSHRSSPLQYMSDAVKDDQSQSPSHRRPKSSEIPVPVQPERRAQRRASVSGMASIPAMQPERDLHTPRSSSLHVRRTDAMKGARNQVSEHLDEYDAIVGAASDCADPEAFRYQASTRLIDSMDDFLDEYDSIVRDKTAKALPQNSASNEYEYEYEQLQSVADETDPKVPKEHFFL
jgi:hypothetical protein